MTRVGLTRVGRGLLAALGAVAWAVVLTAAPAAANTTVTVKGDVVTITVPIDCAGCKGQKGPDGSDLAKYWEKTAEKTWNDAFAKYPYCSKYKFELDVKIHPKGADFKGKKGDHRIQVSTGNPNGRLIPPPGFEGHSSGAYNQDFDGAWDAELPANGVAHEVGHLIGLGDDYVVTSTSPRRTEPKPGRANSMMADGGPVDKALIDGIGQQLEKLGKIDKCERWTGTIAGLEHEPLLSAGGDQPIEGAVTVIVDKHDATTTTGHVVYHDNSGDHTFTLDGLKGTKTKKGFTFDNPGGTEAFPLPAVSLSSRSTAEGKYHYDFPTVYGNGFFEATLKLACTNCKEAVG